jgi:peptide/nickel transport system substrate-binding protein
LYEQHLGKASFNLNRRGIMGRKRCFTRLSLFSMAIILIITLIAAFASPVLAQTPKRGGTLRIIFIGSVVNFGYPPLLRGGGTQVVVPCFETLTDLDAEGRANPGLAKDWKVSADNKSMTFNIRNGIKFHDGSDLDADAVKWNIMEHHAGKRGGIPGLTSVDVLDKYTVRINVKKNAHELPDQLTTGAGRMASAAAIKKNGKDWAKTHPVGTGPFQFVGFKRGDYIKYKRFDGYWKGQPYLDGLEYLFIKDKMTAAASFQAGEGDVITRIFPKAARDLEKKGYRIQYVLSALRALVGDSANPDSIYADKRVREAIEYAINRKAIAKAIGHGLWEPLNQGSPSSLYGYNPGLKGRPYNPEKAKRLLAEAGYPNGFQTKIIVATVYANRDAMTAIQRELQKVGIDAKLDFADPGRWNSHKYKGWKNSLMYMLLGMGANYHRTIYRQLVTMPQYKPMIRPADFTDPLNQAVRADYDAKKKLTQQAVKAMTDHAMIVPLYGTPSISVQDNALHSNFYDWHHIYWNAEKAWLDK